MVAETAERLFERYGPSYRWFVTVGGLLGAFAMVLSATIVNVAVPHVMGAFGIGQDEAQWMATAFIATMTASQLLNAWVVAALGQRAAFLFTLVVFVVGTLISASSQSIGMLILGRVLQGFSAGIVQPLVMVTIFQVFPADRRGLAMGIYGTGVIMAPAVGPAVGGMMIDMFSWRHMFLMPLPFVAVAFVMGAIFMPTRERRGPLPRFDWMGYILLCAAVFLLLTATAAGPREGWLSDGVLIKYIVGGAAAVAFVFSQIRGRAPILDCTLFRNFKFASAASVAFVFGVGNFGSTYVIPVFVQTVQGYTATRAGMVMLPAGLMLVAMLPFTGRIADKLPDHIPVMAGLAFFALGMALMTMSDVNTPFWTFAVFAIVGRIGLAFILPSLNAAALRALPPSQLNKGSGALNFIRQLGGAGGTNAIVVWLQLRTQFHAESLTATQTADNHTVRYFLDKVGDSYEAAGLPSNLSDPLALDYLGRVVYAQAQTMGYQDSFLILAIVFVAALPLAWVLGRVRRPAPGLAPAE